MAGSILTKFRCHPKGAVQLDLSSLENRPELAQLMAQCITRRSYIDAAVSRLLPTFLGATPDFALAMYLGLGSDVAKRNALNAAAAEALGSRNKPDLLRLYNAVSEYYWSSAGDRNVIAHWLWGCSIDPELRDYLLAIDPKSHLLDVTETTRAMSRQEMRKTPPLQNVQVYRVGADQFREVLAEMSELSQMIRYLSILCTTGPMGGGGLTRSTAFQFLKNHPKLQKFLK
jgi:hypothetical protein